MINEFKQNIIRQGLAGIILLVVLAWLPFANAAPGDKSDLNGDSNVDLSDLMIFSTNYLETNWESVDWCLFHESTLAGTKFEGSSTKYYLNHFTELLSFINE